MTAAAGDWLAVPRRGRVEEAVGALEAVRGAGGARARRRGMIAEERSARPAKAGEGSQEGLRRRQIGRRVRWPGAGVCRRVAQRWW